MSNVEKFSISFPKDLLDYVDKKISEDEYSSRSEYIRDAVRKNIIKDKWEEKGNIVIGVLTIIYDHHQRDLTQKIIDIQHNNYFNILCNTHIHLDHHNCLETIIIKGNSKKIQETSKKINGLKGVKFAELTKISSL
jgi:CopG family transcriptional regulator, nickel-responsive regulator